MKNGHVAELFKRHERNPILTAAEWPYAAHSVFNPGAVRLESGETLLLVRVEDQRGLSHLTAARSADGVGKWTVDSEPTLAPDESHDSDEVWGIEDPRIVYHPELEAYSVVYTAYSRSGPHVKLALTKDFVEFDKVGSVMPPEDKDAALFPQKFGQRWCMIHRPFSAMRGTGDIWLSYSPDLRHWGEHQVMLPSRRGAWWDANKIGLSPPPVPTPEGWLILYHGVRVSAGGCLYRLGAALFDLEEPTKLILRGAGWVFGPEQDYECVGDVPNVVFPCGYTLAEDGDTLRLYYGAADACLALATGSIREILDWMGEHSHSGIIT